MGLPTVLTLLAIEVGSDEWVVTVMSMMGYLLAGAYIVAATMSVREPERFTAPVKVLWTVPGLSVGATALLTGGHSHVAELVLPVFIMLLGYLGSLLLMWFFDTRGR